MKNFAIFTLLLSTAILAVQNNIADDKIDMFFNCGNKSKPT